PWKSPQAHAEDKKAKQWLRLNPNADVVPDRYLVRFAPRTNEKDRELAVKGAAGLRMKSFSVLPDVELVQVRLPYGQAKRLLTSNPLIEAVEPEPVVHLANTPNDPSYGSLWGMNQANDVDINAPEAW